MVLLDRRFVAVEETKNFFIETMFHRRARPPYGGCLQAVSLSLFGVIKFDLVRRSGSCQSLSGSEVKLWRPHMRGEAGFASDCKVAPVMERELIY